MGLVPDGLEMRERPVLFMLHGGPGGDHVSFKSTPAALTDVAQLVFIDHRGSGRSAAGDPESWTLENNIEDLEALRKYLGLDRIAMLGSSYGGIVAQGYAVRYPERVNNLILGSTSPSYRFMDESKKIVAERCNEEQQEICQLLWDGNFQSMDQLHDFYRLMQPMYSVSFNAESEIDQQKFQEGWHRGIRNYQQLNMGFGDFLRTFDYIDELHKITCPTLVMAGAHDWICPPSQSRLIAEKIPRAHLKVFPHSSHAIASDEPEAFLAAIRGFLTHAEV